MMDDKIETQIKPNINDTDDESNCSKPYLSGKIVANPRYGSERNHR